MDDNRPVIVTASGAQDRADFLALMAEYLAWGNVEYQKLGPEFAFDEARLLSRIEAGYGDLLPPEGRLFLARVGDRVAGCGAVKRLVDDIGEVKRFYVRPAYRQRGIGARLLAAIIEAGRQIGYRRLRLDSPMFMVEAHRLYRRAGFVDIAPYAESGTIGAEAEVSVFMELWLVP